MSNHTILTRCRFEDEQVFEKYFEVMKKIFIPSINNQKNKDFTLLLSSFPEHFEKIKNEINSDVNVVQLLNHSEDYRNYLKKNNITIQTRHDCDDYMNPDYVETIKKLYESNKIKHDDFVLNFHPTKIIYETGEEYTHSKNYSITCSMFSTLIQKNNRTSIMAVQHTKLNEITKNIIYIPPTGLVKLTIHNNNKLSVLLPLDEPLNKNFYQN